MALGAFTAIGVLIFGHGIIAALIFYITAGILPLLMVCITQAVHSGACQTKKESSGRGALSQDALLQPSLPLRRHLQLPEYQPLSASSSQQTDSGG